MNFLDEICNLFKKGGFLRKKTSMTYEFYRQRPEAPFLFDFIYLYILKNGAGADYYVFCCQRFCANMEMIFLSDRDALIGYGPAYAIGKDDAYDQFSAGYSYDMHGYYEGDSAVDAWNRVFSLWESRSAFNCDVIGVLNSCLFTDIEKNKDLLYGSRNYPGRKPDTDREDYKIPGTIRYLIFILFYFIRDPDNSLFWVTDILENKTFNSKDHAAWLSKWAVVARSELENNIFREVLLPKWAPIKTFVPGSLN